MTAPTEPLTPDEIEAGLKLCEAATPEPWLLSREHGGVETTQAGGDGNVYGGFMWSPDFDETDSDAGRLDYLVRDGGFIAAARTLLPRALAGLREARRDLRIKMLHYETADGNFLRMAKAYDDRGDEIDDLRAKLAAATEAHERTIRLCETAAGRVHPIDMIRVISDICAAARKARTP